MQKRWRLVLAAALALTVVLVLTSSTRLHPALASTAHRLRPTSWLRPRNALPKNALPKNASPIAHHPLNTCAAYTDLDALTHESERHYRARGGLSRRDFAATLRDCTLRHYECFRMQIVAGKVYVVEPMAPAWESRALASLLTIQAAVDRSAARWRSQVRALGLSPGRHRNNSTQWPAWLPRRPVPDIDVMVHVGDYHHTDFHYWAYVKPHDTRNGWAFPEFGLFGWPESGLRSFPESRTALIRDARAVPWHDKASPLVWRGRAIVPVRASLLKAAPSFHPPDQFDIREAQPRGDAFLNMADQCRAYKYHLYTEGWAHSGRLKYQLLCNAVVVAHQVHFREHFYPALVNGTHWIEMPDRHWDRLPSMMRALRDADEADLLQREPVDNATTTVMLAPRAMAEAAAAFAERAFSPDAISCHIQNLAWAYHRVSTWDPFRDPVGGLSSSSSSPSSSGRSEENESPVPLSSRSETASGPAPHPNAVALGVLIRRAMREWIDASGGAMHVHRGFHSRVHHPPS
ncbi:glycosyl transferase family 90-domain-containing protein [Blastocladiella britannica]|nr:glycosyl transferase family 90-domain-containing protein [Blastocladiella britannica]